MLWFDRHRRFRDQLSAYIDGELDALAAEHLEAHLAECGRCRTELERLRDIAAALRGLPGVEVPRSFTLTPEQAAVRRPAPPAAPLAFGMRVAAAGVAVALAAVLMVDLGNFGGDDVTRDAAAPQMQAERKAGEVGFEAGGAMTDTVVPAPAEPGTLESEEGLMSDMDEAEGAPASSAGDTGGEAETPVAGPEEAEEPAAGGDGIDALTAAEIGLGAALGLLVAGGLALAFAGRKR